MKRTARGLLLLSILIAPSVASADIYFFVTNNSSKNVCVYCAGPWFRLGISYVIPSFSNFNPSFYTAESNLFTPIGPWGCGVKETTGAPFADECDGAGQTGLPPEKTNFCVPDVAGVKVNLTVNPDGSIISDKPPQAANGCNDSTVWSFLGESSPAGKQYKGAYRFAGGANEVVTVTLDRDGARGSEGEVAQVILSADGASMERRVGTMPITFTAKLPKRGNYEVTVAYPPADTPNQFRGYYQLDVKAPNGEPVTLEPINP